MKQPNLTTLTPEENYRRAVLCEHPEWIPISFCISDSCWNHYNLDDLQDLMESHSLLFPNFKRLSIADRKNGSGMKKGELYTDPWGCVWKTEIEGIVGAVTSHPLADWSDFKSYLPPNPKESNGVRNINWENIGERMARQKMKDGFVEAGLPHGHTFLRLQDIRGYENLTFDMADDEPELAILIKMVEEFNLSLVERYISLGATFMSYPEDLGMQQGPMLSPEHFRKYIKPVYERMMAPAREAGAFIHMHSDGDVRTLVDDILDCGIDAFNLQDLVNGIDWIAENLLGRVCIDLDIDRQEITNSGTTAQIDELIHEEIEKLSTPSGGLVMTYGLYPGVPLKNVSALMNAMERYMIKKV
jgi:uroporphyrinogen decarboxylase